MSQNQPLPIARQRLGPGNLYGDIMIDDAALSKLIAEAVEEARQQGLDYVGQTERAVQAISTVRPDLTASAALTLVRRLRV